MLLPLLEVSSLVFFRPCVLELIVLPTLFGYWVLTRRAASSDLPRVKPFKHAYEKEIVMYAYFKK